MECIVLQTTTTKHRLGPMKDDLTKRQAISRLMREAALIFSQSSDPDITPVLPKMYAAVHLADQLEDKTPLVICEANLASMNAVCGHAETALQHIEHALIVVQDQELPAPIRNFACTKFVEIAILLGCEHERALEFARKLLRSAADEDGNHTQFYAAVFNLAVVSNDLFGRTEWALSLLSWIADEANPADHPIAQQASRYYQKVSRRFPEISRVTEQAEVEANRDYYLREASNGLLPEHSPTRFQRSDWNNGCADGL